MLSGCKELHTWQAELLSLLPFDWETLRKPKPVQHGSTSHSRSHSKKLAWEQKERTRGFVWVAQDLRSYSHSYFWVFLSSWLPKVGGALVSIHEWIASFEFLLKTEFNSFLRHSLAYSFTNHLFSACYVPVSKPSSPSIGMCPYNPFILGESPVWSSGKRMRW